jgi:hypothetical protein
LNAGIFTPVISIDDVISHSPSFMFIADEVPARNSTIDGKPVNSYGKITYKGDSFNGESKMEVEDMNMVQKISGRRIGSCK